MTEPSQYAVKIIDLEDHQRKDHLLMEIQVQRSEGGRVCR
jgi:hypothetical protein